MARFAKKVDANQPQIVAALRKLGYTVAPGHDDLLVGGSGHTLWVELKAPGKEKQIKPSQKRLLKEWKGAYMITSSLDEILAWFEERS